MNMTLMSQYIEFVADRLVDQFGYNKIYNTPNPFDFMELISLKSKSNFFELKVAEYRKADVNTKGTKINNNDDFEINNDF
jgi:ribonucleoside-diphosphate reductase beta chain